MSKKDYQAIARMIHEIAGEQAGEDYGAERIKAINAVSLGLAGVMAADNPAFDRARFLEACETGRCKGMPR